MRTLALATLVTSFVAACFGDNSSSTPAPPGAPSIREIIAPAEVDLDAPADVTVRVQGQPAQQLSVVLNGMRGMASPESRVLIADDSGAAEMTTTYRAQTAGNEELRVSVATLAGEEAVDSRTFPVFGVERLGITEPFVDPPSVQSAGVLLAYPFTLAAAQTVRKLGVLAPTQSPNAPVDAMLGLYATGSATSVTVLAKTTAKLVPGANELAIPPQTLAAGTYWFVIAYSGAPLVHRSTTQLVRLRYRTDFVFSAGLPDIVSNLLTSAGTLADPEARYYARSLYLVVRK